MIGPASVPRVVDAAAAERDPELAVLSVMAHGHEPGAEALGRGALQVALHGTAALVPWEEARKQLLGG